MPADRNLEIIRNASAYFQSADAEPVTGFGRAHDSLCALCDLLEQIADSIPENIDRFVCSSLTTELMPFIHSVHRFEEEVLYPLAGAQQTPDPTIERLKREHIEDRCFAEELSEALRELSLKRAPANPDALGYMLRGCFETMRRHIAFEHQHLRPFIHN